VTQAAPREPHRSNLFVTTRWSIVLASAGARSGENEATAALAELCRTYWRPVFAYLCRRGHNVPDAQDLTQSFFLKILEGGLLQRADPQRGRFRTLLLHALKNFLIDGYQKQAAKKRGGGLEFISWDQLGEESPAELSPTPPGLQGCAADRLFDIRWAATVVEQAQWRLGEECERRGRRRVFEVVRGHLSADRSEVCYTTLAGQLGIAETAVKRLLHRLRQRYRELLREEVAQTVARSEDVDDELRYLCSTLAWESDR
jgi:RNA polymerase sigma-70 factor (ECF subfamily)